ncbi:hypothetical protein TSAR_007940, partial [Trichomalopsis sarcophagae]
DAYGRQNYEVEEPLVTFPDPDTPPANDNTTILSSVTASPVSSVDSFCPFDAIDNPLNMTDMQGIKNHTTSSDTMKFEQKKMTRASSTKVFKVSLWNLTQKNHLYTWNPTDSEKIPKTFHRVPQWPSRDN